MPDDTRSINPPNCYTSQHLRPQEYGLWEVCMRLTSGGRNKLYFDGRKMAKRFAGITKSSIYRSTAVLVSAGWLIPLNGDGKKVSEKTKRYESTEYRVVTHEEWTATHGCSECASSEDSSPVPSTGTEVREPVPSTGTSSPKTEDLQSQNREIPVPYLGHSFVFSSVKESSVKESSIGRGFVLPDWVPRESWQGFCEMRKKQKKPLTDHAVGLIVEKLKAFRADGTVAAVLDQSTVNGWTDIYPLKRKCAADAASRHTGFDQKDYGAGAVKNPDGTIGF